jgi:hypothetical protein
VTGTSRNDTTRLVRRGNKPRCSGSKLRLVGEGRQYARKSNTDNFYCYKFDEQDMDFAHSHMSTGTASHKYDGVEVEEGGKALIGNKYGGKDFLG